MILTCSECSARYLLPDSAIGPQGRDVRCAQCGNIWTAAARAINLLVSAPSLPPGRRVAFPAAMAPEPEPFWERPTAAELFDAVGRIFGRSRTNYDTGFRPRRNPARLMNMLAIGACTLLLGASGAVLALNHQMQGPIERRAAEQTAQGGAKQEPATPLQISLVSPPKSTVMANGNILFAISGRVRNPSVKKELVPDVVAELRDETGKPIYSWTIHAPRSALLPGESVEFDSSEVDVPADAKSLGLNFMPRWPVRPGAWAPESAAPVPEDDEPA